MEALALVIVAEASVGALGRNAGEAQMGDLWHQRLCQRSHEVSIRGSCWKL